MDFLRYLVAADATAAKINEFILCQIGSGFSRCHANHFFAVYFIGDADDSDFLYIQGVDSIRLLNFAGINVFPTRNDQVLFPDLSGIDILHRPGNPGRRCETTHPPVPVS